MDRIEKSAFRKGEYVGYAHGVWTIRKTNSSYGRWVATFRDDPKVSPIYAFRLADLDAKLGKYLAGAYAVNA